MLKMKSRTKPIYWRLNNLKQYNKELKKQLKNEKCPELTQGKISTVTFQLLIYSESEFAQCGWEINLRNDSHTCWTISFLKVISQPHCTNIFFTHSFHGNTWARQIDLLTSEWLHSSVGKSTAPALQRSWLWNLLKAPVIFQVHIWDNHWDCPASVTIIS